MMKNQLVRFIGIMVLLLSFSCSHSQKQVYGKQGIRLPKIIPPRVAVNNGNNDNTSTDMTAGNTGLLKCQGSDACKDEDPANTGEMNDEKNPKRSGSGQ